MGFFSSVGDVLGFGRDESKAKESSEQRAAPRTSEAQKMWDDYIDRFLGETGPGYRKMLQGQEEELEPVLRDYTGYLTDLMYGRGAGEGLLDPLQISFGEGAPMNIYTQGQRGMLSDLAGLATQRYGVQGSRLPGWSDIQYLTDLWPMLMQTEDLRYSIPSTYGSAQFTGPKQNLLSWANRAGNAMSSFGSGWGDLFG